MMLKTIRRWDANMSIRNPAPGTAATAATASAAPPKDAGTSSEKHLRGDAGPRALKRSLQIADYLARHRDGASLATIAQSIGAPKSSALSLLRSMVELEVVRREGDRYAIGPALINLADLVNAQGRIAPLARPIMQKLQTLTGETVILASLDVAAREVRYVDQIESTNPVRYTVNIGDTRPLYCSGAGRALLAFQEKEWRENYLATGTFSRITENTVTSVDEIRRRLERARIEGVATSSGEVTDGGAAFAAPIFQRDGSVREALLIATVAWRLRDKAEFLREAVMRAAAGLSRALGYEGPIPPDARD